MTWGTRPTAFTSLVESCSYLTGRVYTVVWQQSISAQFRQLILYVGNYDKLTNLYGN